MKWKGGLVASEVKPDNTYYDDIYIKIKVKNKQQRVDSRDFLYLILYGIPGQSLQQFSSFFSLSIPRLSFFILTVLSVFRIPTCIFSSLMLIILLGRSGDLSSSYMFLFNEKFSGRCLSLTLNKLPVFQNRNIHIFTRPVSTITADTLLYLHEV